MLLAMIIEGLSIAIAILSCVFVFNKGIQMSISGGKESNMLEEGSRSKEKVKTFDKQPLGNPNVQGQNNQVSSQGNGFGGANLPDMKGADYGTYSGNVSGLPDIAGGLSGIGAGGGAIAMVGAVNAIAGVSQNGEVSNYNVAAKHVIKGPVIQGGGMIYNDKLKGSKRFLQNAGNGITNTIQGRGTTLTQNAPSRTAISAGKVRIAQNGTAHSYLSGPANKLKSTRTERLESRAPLKVQRLFVGQFTANAGTSRRLRELANGINPGRQMPMGYLSQPMQSMPVVNMGVNNFSLKRITAVSRSNMVFTSQSDGKMAGIVRVFGDPNNAELSDENKNKIGAIISVVERRESNIIPNKIGGAGDNSSSNKAQIENVSRKTLVMYPQFSAKQALTTAVSAAVMMSENNQRKIDRANRIAEERTNPDNVKRNTLDNMLANSSSNASIQFNNYVDDALKENHTISDERLKEIEKEAWEYVQKSNDIPLEEKEKEYEKIKNKKIEDEGGITRDDLVEIVKQRVLNSSEYAQVIIGEDGAKQLNDATDKAKEDKDKIVVQELIKQDVAEHSEYLKSNPKARRKSYYEVYKERKDKELEQNITVAASQLYANQNGEFDKQKYQQLMAGNAGSSGQDQTQEAVQPIETPRIFIARGAQERNINGGV